jgi:hypothetical protein
MNTNGSDRHRHVLWVLLSAVVCSTAGGATPTLLVTPHAAGEAVPAVIVIDARPDWQKKKKILSLNRMSCEFAITRWGDAQTTPGRAQAVAEGLARFLDEPHRAKSFKLTWFTIHRNSRAPSGTKDPTETGLVYDALHAMECRHGDEIIGGVEDAQLTPPAPFIIDIVVQVDEKVFVGRAVGAVAPVDLFGAAISSLARNILENGSSDTPCDRLRKARDASPKVVFYKKSYQDYCVPAR